MSFGHNSGVSTSFDDEGRSSSLAIPEDGSMNTNSNSNLGSSNQSGTSGFRIRRRNKGDPKSPQGSAKLPEVPRMGSVETSDGCSSNNSSSVKSPGPQLRLNINEAYESLLDEPALPVLSKADDFQQSVFTLLKMNDTSSTPLVTSMSNGSVVVGTDGSSSGHTTTVPDDSSSMSTGILTPETTNIDKSSSALPAPSGCSSIGDSANLFFSAYNRSNKSFEGPQNAIPVETYIRHLQLNSMSDVGELLFQQDSGSASTFGSSHRGGRSPQDSSPDNLSGSPAGSGAAAVRQSKKEKQRTFAELEKIERRVIEGLREQVVQLVEWKINETTRRLKRIIAAEQSRRSNTNSGAFGSQAVSFEQSANGFASGAAANPLLQDQGGAWSLTASYKNRMKRQMYSKMRSFTEANFHDIFPEGIEGTALTDSTVVQLVAALLTLPFLTDGDLSSARFPINPSVRVTSENFPSDMLSTYFSYIGAKAAVRAADAPLSAWREAIQNFYYHHQNFQLDASYRTKVAVTAIGHYMEISHVEPTDRDVSMCTDGSITSDMGIGIGHQRQQAFYQFCLELERRLTNSENCDNTISVEYQRGEVIGKGAFGVVYRCTHTGTGQFLALKELSLSNRAASEQAIRSEIDTLKRLSHQNIIKYYGCRFDRDALNVAVLMEYAPKNLREVATSSKGGLSLKLIATYARKILQGLAYLHRKGIIHRDIKAANVLVSESGEVKLTDFGTALTRAVDALHIEASAVELMMSQDQTNELRMSILERKKGINAPSGFGARVSASTSEFPVEAEDSASFTKPRREDTAVAFSGSSSMETGRVYLGAQRRRSTKQVVGTPLFIAPEVLCGSLPDESSDIWAFGCMLIELVTGQQPWQELLDEVGGVPIEVIMYRISGTKQPPKVPSHVNVSTEFMNLLNACLNLEPTMRPSAEELLSFDFFDTRRQASENSINTGVQSKNELTAQVVTVTPASGRGETTSGTYGDAALGDGRRTSRDRRVSTEVTGLNPAHKGGAADQSRSPIVSAMDTGSLVDTLSTDSSLEGTGVMSADFA